MTSSQMIKNNQDPDNFVPLSSNNFRFLFSFAGYKNPDLGNFLKKQRKAMIELESGLKSKIFTFAQHYRSKNGKYRVPDRFCELSRTNLFTEMYQNYSFQVKAPIYPKKLGYVNNMVLLSDDGKPVNPPVLFKHSAYDIFVYFGGNVKKNDIYITMYLQQIKRNDNDFSVETRLFSQHTKVEHEICQNIRLLEKDVKDESIQRVEDDLYIENEISTNEILTTPPPKVSNKRIPPLAPMKKKIKVK